MNRTAPLPALLAMLVCAASFQPAVAIEAPYSGSLNVGHPARPWKLSCTNGIAGAFASAITPVPRTSPGPTYIAPPSPPPQLDEIVLRNGTVNASSAAWKNSFALGTSSRPQQCTLELHREPMSTSQYSLSGARPVKLVSGPNGQVSELVLVYAGISQQNLQVTP
jgi:hypothetical protein